MMQAMIGTEALRRYGSAQRAPRHRIVRVLLPAARVLRDSTVIEGVLDALFDHLPTTTVVVCVHQPPQDTCL
jgi:hypothetical protein